MCFYRPRRSNNVRKRRKVHKYVVEGPFEGKVDVKLDLARSSFLINFTFKGALTPSLHTQTYIYTQETRTEHALQHNVTHSNTTYRNKAPEAG
jgi:hypothetical protein